MAVDIDELQIQINANATRANDAIDKLVGKLDRLSTSLNKIDGSKIAGLGNGVNKLSIAMQGLNNVKSSDFTRLANNIQKLSNLNTSGLNASASALSQITRAFNNLGGVSANAQQVGVLASNLSRLGYKSVANAVANIPQLANSLNYLMTVLSRSPQVSSNIIQMTNALANLASQSRSIGTATRAMTSGLNSTGASMTRASKGAFSLASAFGKLYANYFLLIRGGRALWGSVEKAMDFIETLNYFNAAMEQVVGNVDLSAWEELGYDSAEAYANSFSERATELTAKMTGYTISATGTIKTTGVSSLGIDPNTVLQYQAMFSQMASSMGVSSNAAIKLSNALTMIGADLASVKNMDFDQVWTNMASGLAGMSRSMDKYGANIRLVNLQQKLNELGINANIDALNQNDKALLRTIIILDSTRYAWGDLADTLNQPANQLRLLSANLSNLGRTIGTIFIPIIKNVVPYVNGFVIALQRLFTMIGEMMGVDMSKVAQFGSSTGDNEILSDILDDANDATEAVKELKNQMFSFDEMNKFNDTDGVTVGVSSEDTSKLEGALDDMLSEYQKTWDEAYEQMENKANAIAESILASWKKIADSPAIKTIGNFIDSFANMGEKSGKSMFEGISSALKDMEGFNDKKLKDIKGHLDKIDEYANNIADAIETIGDAYDSEAFSGFIENVTKLADVTMMSNIEKALGFIGDVIGMFSKPVTDNADKFAEALQLIFEIAEILTGPLGELADIIAKNDESYEKSWLHKAMTGITDFFTKTEASYLDNIIDTLRNFRDLLKGDIGVGNFSSSLSGLSTNFNALKTSLTTVETAFKKTLGPIAEWFKTDVSDKISGYSDDMKTSINNAFKRVGEGAFNSMVTSLNTILGGFEKVINFLIDGVNSFIKSVNTIIGVYNKLPGTNDLTKFSPLGEVTLGRIKGYEVGGFPDKSSLFWANEHGIPELIGQMNGSPAVASGMEITGIREEIRATANEEIILLRQQNELLQGILNKEFGISNKAIFNSVKQSANNYTRQTGQPAFA